MVVTKQIKEYFAIQPEPKRTDMYNLYQLILGIMPNCRLWFLDGKDGQGKIVTGYCIKFKELKNINIDVLEVGIKDCVKLVGKNGEIKLKNTRDEGC